MTEAESALERFAQRYRLKIRRDEAGEPIIPGRRGHLWWDAEGLCLMIVDGRPVSTRRLKDLVGDTGKVWLGTITLDDHGRRVQDVEVRGIRPERYTQAIKIAGCKARKRHPGASREVLARATAASLKRRTATEHSHAPELRGEAVPGGRYQAAATGPFCAATAPARAAARSMPPEQSGPARGMPRKRATGAYIAPVGRGKARSTTPPAARESGAASGPARGILLGDPRGAAPAWPLRPLQATASMPHAGRRWRCCRPGLAAGAATWPPGLAARGGARKAGVATLPALAAPRDLAARARPAPQGRPRHKFTPRPAAKNNSAPKCCGANFIKEWRFA